MIKENRERVKTFLMVIPRIAACGELYVFPLGIAYVSAFLKRQGFRVICLNLCHSGEPVAAVMAGAIREHDVDVVCTGGVTYHWDRILEVVDTAKRIRPDIVTVVGGAVFTSDPDFVMNTMPVDIGVMGEGEITMGEVAERLNANASLRDLQGVVFRESGVVRKNELRAPIADLDSLPFPDYEGFEYDKWLALVWDQAPLWEPRLYEAEERQRYGQILTSRSCPYGCTFCYHPLGNKYRQRSLDNVEQEIDHLVNRYHINYLSVLDELFSVSDKRSLGFADIARKYRLRWHAQWRVDNASASMFTLLKEAGMEHVGLGLESASDVVLKSMKKRTSREKIDRAYRLAFEAGIYPCGNLIYGDIAETKDTIRESLEWWYEHPEYCTGNGFIMTIPDSPLFRHALETGLIQDRNEYIKSRNWIINLTSMENSEVKEQFSLLAYWHRTRANLRLGKVLSSEKTGKSAGGRDIYEVSLRCPECGSEDPYEFCHHDYGDQLYDCVLCRQCDIRFKVEPFRCFPDKTAPGIPFFTARQLVNMEEALPWD